MVIKNTTTYTNKTIEKAAIASNYNNEQYKRKKLAFNFVGLVSGMVTVSILSRNIISQSADAMLLAILFGIICAVCLFIGMYVIDKNKYAAFHKKYSDRIGKVYHYEIDSENIEVKNDGEVAVLHWLEVKFFSEDKDNFYLFFNEFDWIALSKKGFTSCSEKDLKMLYRAIEWEKKTQENKK